MQAFAISPAWRGVPTVAGAVLDTWLFSPALDGNFRTTPPTRHARVYLPPDYGGSDRRYAVLYYLHGAWGDEDAFFKASGEFNANRLTSQGEMAPMIIVGVDAGDGAAGLACYENSELNGNYEDYIVQDGDVMHFRFNV